MVQETPRLSVLGRILLGIIIFAVCVPACSRKKTEPVTKNDSAEKTEAEEVVQPTRTEENLAEDLFQLMKQAELENGQGKFEESLATWKRIHQQVSDKYGLDGWQTVSAELAMTAARQRTKMSASDQGLARELTQLTSSAARAIEKQNFNEGRIDIEKAAGISIRLWGKESYVSANVNFIRARCYLGLGLYERGVAVLNDVLSLRISLTGLNHPDVESTLELLSNANSALQDHAAAQQSLKKLVQVSGQLWGRESDLYANRCNELGVSYNNSRQPNLALPWFDEALAVREKLHGKDSLSAGHVCLNRGLAQAQLKEYDRSNEDLKRALGIFRESQLSEKDATWSVILDQLGTIALVQKENSEGQKYFSELADFWKNKEGENHLEYGKSLYKLSVSIGNQGRYSEAEPIMKKSLSIFESQLGYNNKLLQQPLTTYARLLEKMGVEQEAKKFHERAVRLAGFQELPN